MKVGVTIHSYMLDVKLGMMTPKAGIEHAASVGAECVELVDAQFFLDWPHPKLTTLFETRDFIQELGMSMCCLSSYVNNERTIDTDYSEAEKIQQIKESILRAYVLEAPIVKTGPLEHLEAIWDRMIQECLPFAQKYGVKLGIEIHAPMNPERAITLIEKCGSESLGLVPDFSTWWNGGNVPLESFMACLPYTNHIHAKAQQISNDGEVLGIPFESLLSLARNAGYEGSIAVEFEPRIDASGEHENRPIEKRPMDLLGKEAVEILVPIIKKFA